MINKYMLGFMFILHVLNVFSQDNQPVILNHTETVRPGEIIGLQGSGFGTDANVHFAEVKGNEKALKPQKQLPVLTKSEMYVAVKIPENVSFGLYAVWVTNGQQQSEPVFINLARVTTNEFDEIMPGSPFRLFGRNLWLEGKKAVVRFVPENGSPVNAQVISGNPHEITVMAPAALSPGVRYTVYVNNGVGGKYGDSPFFEPLAVRKPGTDPFGLNVPWGADFTFSDNVYNVKNDSRLSQHAKGDGQQNDRAAIQEAIDKAAEDGGGVVYLPAGSYRLEYAAGSGITMQSRVVLKGDGAGKTVIKYGYGNPFSTERVKAAYGWTLGWPDARAEGMGMVWPGFITTSGLVELSVVNVNESGKFVHSIKNMPEGGSKIMLKNCGFDFSDGWGLAMVNIDKFLMSGCEVKITGTDVRGINAPTRTWPLDFKNSGYYNVRDNKIYYCAGRFGVNGCHHAFFENNAFIRDGNHQSKGETGGLNFDYAGDVVIQKNQFLVTGKTIEAKNQGETILSQGGGAHQQTLGSVTRATANTLTDNSETWLIWQDFTERVSLDWQFAVHPTNYFIAIIDGVGTGQWRTITQNSDTTVVIDRPWDVIPAPGSKYVIAQWSVYRGLIKDNILKDNHQGIMLYCGGTDVVITGNELTNSGGIYLRSDQRIQYRRYNLTWNVSVVDNKVVNTNGLRSAHIAMFHVKVRNDNSDILGTGSLGIEMRRNLVQASVPNVGKAGGSSGLGAEGYINRVDCGNADGSPCDLSKVAIIGTIIENNTAVNSDNAYFISSGAYNTVIVQGKMENVSNPVMDTGAQNTYMGGSHTQK
jgi:hypothetical protein